MTLEIIVFYIMAILCVGSALWMVATKNPVRSALSLVVTFLSVAVLYVLLSAQFIAAVQVIVYAGAIMVLFLFVIMLLNLGAPQTMKETGGISKWVAAALGFGLLVVLFSTQSITLLPPPSVATEVKPNSVSSATHALAVPVKVNLEDLGTAETIGKNLYNPELPWLFPFEAVSLLLLVAVVGAIIMAKRQIT